MQNHLNSRFANPYTTAHHHSGGGNSQYNSRLSQSLRSSDPNFDNHFPSTTNDIPWHRPQPPEDRQQLPLFFLSAPAPSHNADRPF